MAYLKEGHEIAAGEVLQSKIKVVLVLERAVQFDEPRRLSCSKKISLAAHVHDLVPATHLILVENLAAAALRFNFKARCAHHSITLSATRSLLFKSRHKRTSPNAPLPMSLMVSNCATLVFCRRSRRHSASQRACAISAAETWRRITPGPSFENECEAGARGRHLSFSGALIFEFLKKRGLSLLVRLQAFKIAREMHITDFPEDASPGPI
jgi:hypothetical protein